MRRFFLALFLGLLCLAPAALAQQAVFYGSDPRQKVLLYPAPGPGPHPVLVFVHGGAWVLGAPRGAAPVAAAVNAVGWTLASVGYRLVPDVPVETSIADVATAIAYLVREAPSLGLDARRMALAGHSSGAHVAALLAADPSWLRAAGVNPRLVRAAVLLDGVYDVESNLTHFPSPAGRHDVFGQDRARWRRLSPTSYLAGGRALPLFCVAHEDTDPRLSEQSQIFLRALRANGERFTDLPVPGFTHIQMLRQASDPGAPIAGFIGRCLSGG